jgi:hypothetical protein
MISLTPIACATCQLNTAGSSGDAAGWSILFLLVVILLMLGGVGTLMFRMMRRDSQMLDPELSDDFIRPSTH